MYIYSKNNIIKYIIFIKGRIKNERKKWKILLTLLILALIIIVIAAVVLIYKNYKNTDNTDVASQPKDNTSKEVTPTTESNTEEEKILLYDGYAIEIKTRVQNASDMKLTDNAINTYSTTYYNYGNGKYEGSSVGYFGEETYEGYSLVQNVKKIAMNQEYDAIPRSFSRTSELPGELMEMADCTSVNIDSVDLDGDGQEEKILCYTVSYLANQIGDGEPQASSGIMLFDSSYNKIADLVTLDDGFWAGIKEEDKKIFLSLDNVEYIDIDEDEIMEIIIEVPTYEGLKISILKYNNGDIEGKTDLKASVLP